MAEVAWIKLYTDMFTRSRKINNIENKKNGDTYLIIWIKLLLLAGIVNDGGAIYVTKNVPYKISDLAYELRRPEKLVESALSLFEGLDMIERENRYIYISSWEEYQNQDKLSAMREKDRERKRKERDKARSAHGQSTDSPRTHADKSIDCPNIDKEVDKDNTTTTTIYTSPTLSAVYVYFDGLLDGGAAKEAEKFHAYNANRGWDCLPDWKNAADLWIARIEDARRTK